MNQYNGYCYPDMTILIDVIQSEPIQVSGTNVINSTYVSYSGNSATFSTALGNYTRTFSTCSNVGPMTTVTNMTPSDALELSGMILAVWCVAWALRTMHRAM